MFISPENIKLKRELGLFSLILIGIGGTLGGGIFVLLSEGVELAGIWLPLSFVVGSVLALSVALMYGEIASSVPAAGAGLEFLFTAYDKKMLPFVVSWLTILGDLAFVSLNLLGLSYHLRLLVPLPPLAISLVVLALVTFVNVKGTKAIGRFQTIVALFLLLLLGGFLFFAGRRISWEKARPLFNLGSLSITGILSGAALVFTSFIGYEDLAAMAGEAKKPSKNLPRSLVLTVVISSLIFLLICVFALLLVPVNELSRTETPLLVVAKKLGPVPTLLIRITAIVATFTSFSVTLFMASRKLYALSKYNFFKNFFAELNENQIPTNSVLFCAFTTVFLVMSGSVSFMAYLGNSTYFITLISLSLGLFLLRKKRPHLKRPFKVPFYPFSLLFIALFCLVLLFFMGSSSLLVTLFWGLVGFFLYLFSFINKKSLPWVFYGILFWLLVNGGLAFYFLYLF